MPLDRFVTHVDVRALLYAAGVVFQAFGLVLAVPLLVAVLGGEGRVAPWFGLPALACLGIGVALAWRKARDLNLGDALLVAAGAYLAAAVVGAIPFLPYAGPVDALFESMSGFTTTGLSVVPLDALPDSVLFFRSWSQWVGGAGIVGISLALLMGPGTTARRLYATERGEPAGAVSALGAARTVVSVYVIITLLGWVALIVAGMQPLSASVHTLSTVSTGGFSPWSDSVAHFGPAPMVQMTLMVLMLAGAVTVPLYVGAWRHGIGRLLRDRQVRALAVGVPVAGLVLWAAAGLRPSQLGPASFHAVSALTTTGYAITDPATWSDSAKLAAILLMVAGGPNGSSAGGMKLFRVILLARLTHWMALRALLPDEARVPLKYGDLVVSDREMAELMAFVAAYMALLVGGALALSFAGVPGLDALFESASAMGTVGLSTSPELPAWGKLLIVVQMWAGRLEVLPVIVLLYRAGRWRRTAGEGDHRRDG